MYFRYMGQLGELSKFTTLAPAIEVSIDEPSSRPRYQKIAYANIFIYLFVMYVLNQVINEVDTALPMPLHLIVFHNGDHENRLQAVADEVNTSSISRFGLANSRFFKLYFAPTPPDAIVYIDPIHLMPICNRIGSF